MKILVLFYYAINNYSNSNNLTERILNCLLTSLLNYAIIDIESEVTNMGKVLYNKNGIILKREYGDIALYTPYNVTFATDTPENLKKICKIAEIKMKDLKEI